MSVMVMVSHCARLMGIVTLLVCSHRLRCTPVGLEGLLKAVQNVLVGDDDAQLTVMVERVGGDVFGADEGLLAVNDDDFGVHIQLSILLYVHVLSLNGIDAVPVAIGRG